MLGVFASDKTNNGVVWLATAGLTCFAATRADPCRIRPDFETFMGLDTKENAQTTCSLSNIVDGVAEPYHITAVSAIFIELAARRLAVDCHSTRDSIASAPVDRVDRGSTTLRPFVL